MRHLLMTLTLILLTGLLVTGVPGGTKKGSGDTPAAGTGSYPGLGRTVTILLTLSEPGNGEEPGPDDSMSTLLGHAVNWAGKGVPDLKVLVIRDDNNHGEWPQDTDHIFNAPKGLGYAPTLLNEGEDGVGSSDLEGYDVVLLSNPGYPVDDAATVTALQAFFEAGGGVILQGDDISQGPYPLQALTGLCVCRQRNYRRLRPLHRRNVRRFLRGHDHEGSSGDGRPEELRLRGRHR